MPTGGTIACPYCNAYVSVPPGAGAGRRLSCPRCGEAFAYLPRDGMALASAPDHANDIPLNSFTTEPPAAAAADTDSLRSKGQLLARILGIIAAVLLFVGAAYLNSLASNGVAIDFATFASVAVPLAGLWAAVGGVASLWLWFFRTHRSNGATAAFVLANMVTLALVTLGGALATQSYRRHIDVGLPARPKRSPVVDDAGAAGPAAVVPARLAALGYLPPKIDLLAGVHVAELLADPAGSKLVTEQIKFGDTGVRLVPEKIGLSMQELDHFVVGLRTDEPLSVVFVFRTKQPYDALKVRQVLNARSLPGKSGERTIYQVTVPGLNLAELLWFADEQTLLIALARELLETATLPSKDVPAPLDKEVAALLKDRVGPVGQLWAVGHVADWEKGIAGLLMGRLPGEWPERLGEVRAFGAWAVSGDNAVTLNAAVHCKDDKTTERLEKWLEGRTAGKKNAPALARDGSWLSLQLRTDPETIRGLFAP
jgi:hypothetical protein